MSAPNAAKSSMNSSENSMKQSVALPAANRPSANGRERCSPRRASPSKNARGIALHARAVNNVVLSVNHFACNHPSRKGAVFCFGSRMRYRFSRYRFACYCFACYRFSRYRFACYRFACSLCRKDVRGQRRRKNLSETVFFVFYELRMFRCCFLRLYYI